MQMRSILPGYLKNVLACRLPSIENRIDKLAEQIYAVSLDYLSFFIFLPFWKEIKSSMMDSSRGTLTMEKGFSKEESNEKEKNNRIICSFSNVI